MNTETRKFSTKDGNGIIYVTIQYISDYYHHWEDTHRIYNSKTEPPFRLIIAFNAGIWGYDSWLPTLRYVMSNLHYVPFIFTSYNKLEADDSIDTINSLVEEINKHKNDIRCNNIAGTNTTIDSYQPLIRINYSIEMEDTPFPSKLADINPTTGSELHDNAVWTCFYTTTSSIDS